MQITKRKYPTARVNARWGVVNFYEWCCRMIDELNEDEDYRFYLKKFTNRKIAIMKEKRCSVNNAEENA